MTEKMDGEQFVRQTVLPQIGPEGQRRLNAARVLVAGCGALGTHTAEALLRAGVGRLILVDRDVLEIHNLHRVSLFTLGDVGRPKAEVAAEKLKEINPAAEIIPYVEHLGPKLVEDLVPQVDLVVDGLDNLESRYMVNDSCVKHGKPWIYTAVLATYGMTMAIVPEKGPCLRCLFPTPPAPGTLPTCAQAGVLGPVPQALAALQATTAIAMILGQAQPGELFYLDLWRKRAQTVKLERAPHCPTCVGKDFAFLREASRSAILCGDAVQILPRKKERLDLLSLARTLGQLGKAEVRQGLLFAEIEGYSFTVFPDGRTLIKGVTDPGRAQALYDQFISR